MNLNDNQKKAIKKLENLRVGALFMEPGTGKTLAAIKLIESSETDFVLWITPFRTKENLQEELEKWKFKKKVKIIGVESLSNSDRLYIELLNELNKYDKPFIVVDESLKIKNNTAKRTQRVLELGKNCYYKLILNGTPISKNALDLYTQINFLSPKILNMSHDQFKNTFLHYIEFKGKQTKILKHANMDYLYSLIEPYVFEAKLDLNVTQDYLNVPYKINNKEEYKEIKEKFLTELSDYDNSANFLAYAQKMQQSYSIDEDKLQLTKSILNATDKTIIFCKFVKTKEELEKIKRKDDLVITYGKGSLGLNLQEYRNIIFFDKTWDYAQLEQAKRRIYRTGQTRDVNYYMLTGDVGLERMMNRCIDKKMSILDMFKQSSLKELEDEL